jgi:TonB-dependent receptor
MPNSRVRGPARWAFFVLALIAARPLAAQDASGRIAGRAVEAEAADHPLQGAVAALDGTPYRAVTDAEGRFLIGPVPAGSYTLTLSYLGRATQRRPVTVAAGQALSVEIAAPAGAVELAGVTVVAARARVQAEALNRQRSAPNIMNVVAADQIARFPDASAPEAVQRVPGVSIARDQGEGRYIQIRGGSPANTQVTLNGVQIPSPEGEERQIALDAVPVDLLDGIEVSKAILPSMDADAVGGSVNLVTRRAPAGGVFSVEGAGGYAALRERPSSSAALTWGNRWMDDRLGLIVTGSFNQRAFGSDDVEPSYDLGDAGSADDALEELQVRYYTLTRRRMGATAALDFQLAPASRLTLTGFTSELRDHEQRRNLVNAVEDGELQFHHKNRLEELRTHNLTLFGEHRLGGLKVSHSLAWTRSQEHTPFDDEIQFVQEDVDFSPALGDGTNVQANPGAGALGGPFAFDEISLSRTDTRNTDWTGSLDLAHPYRLGPGAAGELRFGFRIRDKDKTQRVATEAAELNDDADDIVLGQGIGSSWANAVEHPGRYPMMPFATRPGEVRDFAGRHAGDLDREADLEEETNDYDLGETVTAGYVMTELNLGPALQLIPGVRYEHTSFDSRGFDFDPDEETLTPRSDSRSYDNLFPMAHVRYALGRRTNLRAAFTTAIARPNFFDLVPYRLRDDEDITTGNPELKPTTSRNFDLLLEHYDDRIGVASAGVFLKRLSDPIFVFTQDNDLGGETEQPRNGRHGTIRGVELALQRQLSELPFPFDGLGIYGNYTFTDSDAQLPNGREVRLQGQAKHVFNAAVGYERRRFWGQLSLNYHGDYVTEYADDAFEDAWVKHHLQLDGSLNVRVAPRGTVFLELVNLTNEPYIVYQGDRSRPIQMEYYDAWGRIGFRLTH